MKSQALQPRSGRLALILLAMLLAALLAPGVPWAEVHQAEQPSVIDGWERKVELARPAQRVVALAPHLAEVVFALEAGSRLVGAVSHSDYPEAATEVPRVGDAFSVSLESVVAMQPDLILAWSATMTPARVQRFEQLGMPVFVSDPADIDRMLVEMDAIARLLGHNADAVLASLRTRVAAQALATRADLRVLPLIAAEPLMSVGRGHYLDDLLGRCGGANPFAEHIRRDGVVQLSREALLQTELDLVINLTRAELPRRLRLSAAVEVVALDPDLLVRPGPRMVQGLEQLCAALDAVRQARP